MSKRAPQFERRAADFYPTPFVAVKALIPWLRGVSTFAEPCAGDGALVRHLESFGLRCVHASDISTGQDALALDHYGGCDAIITNPPYTRPIMHKLIAHFARVAPTWLLLESDWTSTKQASPFMSSCSDIVSIGRLKWFADSKHTGKDNFAWLRFDAKHTTGPAFHWRTESEAISSRLRKLTANRRHQRALTIINICAAGGFLRKGTRGFFLEPGGRHVAAKYAREAIASGEIVPFGGDLFGNLDNAQTWIHAASKGARDIAA